MDDNLNPQTPKQPNPTPLPTLPLAPPELPPQSTLPQAFASTDPITPSSSPEITPQSAATQAAPGVVGLEQPAIQTLATGPSSAQPFWRRKLFLLIGAGALVLLAAVLFFVLHAKSITYHDITTAQDLAHNFSADINDASLAISELQQTESVDAATSKASVVTTKLADARKQFNELKKSAALGDETVKQKFNALEKKWEPYLTFLENSAKDYEALSPLLTSFESSLTDLNKSAPSTKAELSTYLSSLQTVLSNLRGKTSSIKLSLTENQKILTAFQTFIDDSLQAITTAQTDLTGGKSIYTVQSDLFKIYDAQSTFSDTTYDVESQLRDTRTKLDPYSAIRDLQNALSDLALKHIKDN